MSHSADSQRITDAGATQSRRSSSVRARSSATPAPSIETLHRGFRSSGWIRTSNPPVINPIRGCRVRPPHVQGGRYKRLRAPATNITLTELGHLLPEAFGIRLRHAAERPVLGNAPPTSPQTVERCSFSQIAPAGSAARIFGSPLAASTNVRLSVGAAPIRRAALSRVSARGPAMRKAAAIVRRMFQRSHQRAHT